MTLLQDKIPPPPPPKPLTRKLGHLSAPPPPESAAERFNAARTCSWDHDEPGTVRKVLSGNLADTNADFISTLEHMLACKRPSLPDLSDPAYSNSNPMSPRTTFGGGSPKISRFITPDKTSKKTSTKTFPPPSPKPKSPKIPRREVVAKTPTAPMDIRTTNTNSPKKDRSISDIMSPRTESTPGIGRGSPPNKSLNRAKSRILGFSAAKPRTNKTHQVFVGDALEKGMLAQVAALYVKQKFPDVPWSQIRLLLRREKNLGAVLDFLVEHGWEEKSFNPEYDPEIPGYYYGTWSYDCWLAFERCSVGSYISCTKAGEYCVVYKSASGDVITETIPEETPEVSKNLIKKYALTTPVLRPPKRLVCEVCKNNTPCKALTSDHACIPVNYPLVAATQSWKDFLLSC